MIAKCVNCDCFDAFFSNPGVHVAIIILLIVGILGLVACIWETFS